MTELPVDLLVRAAQRGNREALESLLAGLRGPLTRFARGLAPGEGDHDDAVQEALLDIARGIGTYRWESSFLSWCYRVCARRVARRAATHRRELAEMTDRLEAALAGPPEPYDEHESFLTGQDAHLACAMVVAVGLSPRVRQAYLLGEVLGVTDQVGAQACDCTPAAFRQRVSRGRRTVNASIRESLEGAGSPVADPAWTTELDRLLDLGALHRAHGRPADARAATLAAARAAPTLLAR